MNKQNNNFKIDLLMFNMSSYSEWQKGVNNRNYQFLINLLENERVNKILAVDYLPFTLKRTLKNYKENILENLPKGEVIYRSLLSKLTKITDQLFVYSTIKSFIYPSLIIKELKKILNLLNFTNLMTWSCFPLWLDYYHAFQEKLTVFDTIDNWAEHPSYLKIKDKILKNYQKISQDVDLIFTVSEEVQKVFPNRQKIIWLPNGVDFSHFQKEYNLINRDIGDFKKPIIGYAGVIQDKLDLDLLKQIAEKFREMSIVLIGPVWYNYIIKEMKNFSNVYFLGYKNYQELPMYLQQFAVAIIPHKADKFSLSTNPMKLYEYLACGKPVVTIYQKELETFTPYIYLAKNNDEFINFINQALSEDSLLLKEKRQELVKEQTWKKRVNTMLDYIFQELGY